MSTNNNFLFKNCYENLVSVAFLKYSMHRLFFLLHLYLLFIQRSVKYIIFSR